MASREGEWGNTGPVDWSVRWLTDVLMESRLADRTLKRARL
jgi:hypothetical protein